MVGYYLMMMEILTLIDEFVPEDSKERENLQNLLIFVLDVALHIGIFDTQQKLLVALFGEDIIKNGGSQIANVHIPRRTWSKT